jgi:uncharacterized membrane protein
MFYWLEKFGIDTGGFDRWQVTLAGLDSLVAWALILAAVIAVALWTLSSVRDLASAPRRAFLVFWQLLTLAFLVIIFLQPAIRLAKVAEVKDRVTVLIDTSNSMTLPAGVSGGSRLSEALEFISDHERFFRDLEEEFVVTYYGFDTTLRAMEGRPRGDLESDGDGTDIMAAIFSASGSAGSAPLAGLVLVSDGADTGGWGRSMRFEAGEIETRNLLKDFNAPVNTVACGRGGSVRDLAVMEVRHDDYGFVHNPFDVEVEIWSEGGLASQVPVIFKQGERVIASKTITLEQGEKRAVAKMSFTPRQVGEFIFSVEVPPVPGEVTGQNNYVRFPLKVLRDKVRILYIVGNPSWDERFLRRTLKKDPSVDLVSFYILREHWDDYMSRKEEVSLIQFPTQDLFTKELDTFDLVIWQNFRGPIYMVGAYSKYMSELNRFVRDRGGALLMIGGHRAFFGQGRLDPKLLELLPVEPSELVPNYIEGEFKIELSDAGLRHPIMAVGEGDEDLTGLWSRLPALSGYNRVSRAAPGSLVLAEHPYERGVDGELLPVVAVREAGAGRVMTVMTDYSWQWNFAAVGEGLSNKPYQRFWENALRWLLQDPEMRLITAAADKGRVEPGEKVTIMLEILDETYNPTDQANISLEIVEQPEGSRLVLPELERFGSGKYRLEVTPETAGGYRLRVTARLGGRSLGHDDVIFEAAKKSAEWMDVLPRPENLAAISRATNGTAVAASEGPEEFAFKRSKMEQVVGSKDVPLWDNWPVFLVCFSMMVVGWYFRRKWGLR